MFGDSFLFLFSKIGILLFSNFESKMCFSSVFNPFFFCLVIVFSGGFSFITVNISFSP